MLENMAGKDCLGLKAPVGAFYGRGTDAFANYHTARVYKQLLSGLTQTSAPHTEAAALDWRGDGCHGASPCAGFSGGAAVEAAPWSWQVRQELLRRGLFETER